MEPLVPEYCKSQVQLAQFVLGDESASFDLKYDYFMVVVQTSCPSGREQANMVVVTGCGSPKDCSNMHYRRN